MHPDLKRIIGAKFICFKCNEEFWHFWTEGNLELVMFYGSGSGTSCKLCGHNYVKNLYFRPKCAILCKIVKVIKIIFGGHKTMISSAIEQMDYQFNDGKPMLDIEFKSGGKYRYFDVPLSVFNGFANADSRGRFFQESIRGQFKFEKLS